MKKLFSILVFGLVLSLFPLAASAVPAFPMNFTGTVSINGVNAPVGSVIKAYDGTSLLAQFTLTTAGTYGNSDRTQQESAKLSIPEYTGSPLTFKINSPQYSSNAQLSDTESYGFEFSSFTDVEQNLVFTGGIPSVVVSIAVTPATASVVANSTQQFTATGTYTDASTTDMTSSCSWTSSNTSVATIGGSTGLATGASAGTATITASYTDSVSGDLSDTASLTVTALPSGGGGGGGGGDASAPSISSITISVASTTATISWTTSESSISWVIYGETTAYGSEEKITTYTKSHSVTLTALSPATAYYYKVKSKDISGNVGTYTGKTFTTLTSEGEVVVPVDEDEVAEIPIGEMTISQLEAKIAEIVALIAQLQIELAKLIGVAAIEGVPAGFTFDANLSIGSTGNAVKYLQIVLNSASDTQLAASGVGSSGNETTYFGPLTKSGVIKFQEKYASDVLATYGLTSGTGYVGKTTRAKLNTLLGQ